MYSSHLGGHVTSLNKQFDKESELFYLLGKERLAAFLDHLEINP